MVRSTSSSPISFTLSVSDPDNLATPSTLFQDKPQVDFGVVPGNGVNLLWPVVMGSVRSRYFILTRQELNAETAKEWGAVNEIVPADRLLTRARDALHLDRHQ